MGADRRRRGRLGIALTLLTGGLVGALWGLVLAIVGCAYGYRWTREWWRNSRDRPGGPDHSRLTAQTWPILSFGKDSLSPSLQPMETATLNARSVRVGTSGPMLRSTSSHRLASGSTGSRAIRRD